MIISLIIATGASLGVDRAWLERVAISRHSVGIDAEPFGDGIGAQPFAQLLGDFPLQCWIDLRSANRFAAFGAFYSGSLHASARSLTDLLRLYLGQARHDGQQNVAD